MEQPVQQQDQVVKPMPLPYTPQVTPGVQQQIIPPWQQFSGTPPPGTDLGAYYADMNKAYADYYAALYPSEPTQTELKDAQVDAIKNIFGVTLADSEISPEVTILTVEE